MSRERAMALPQGIPCLVPHARLQFCTVRQKWALLAPEKVFWPDETSMAILQACNGKSSIEQIISQLAEDYAVPETEIAQDISGFLQEWADQRLISITAREA